MGPRRWAGWSGRANGAPDAGRGTQGAVAGEEVDVEMLGGGNVGGVAARAAVP
ncbi:MAG TPA: hypothetical protein VIY28_19855 [Pseudonocardiaceae bacterium]